MACQLTFEERERLAAVPAPTCKRCIRPTTWLAAKFGSEQPPEFFAPSAIEADGTLVETAAECKQGSESSWTEQIHVTGLEDLLRELDVDAVDMWKTNCEGGAVEVADGRPGRDVGPHPHLEH